MFKKIFPVLIILMMASSSLAISSDPLDIGVGARPLGMGKAFAGMAPSSNSLFLNPSGIAGVTGLSVMSMSGKLLQDVNYTTLGFVYPLPLGTLGVGYVSSGSEGFPITRRVGTSIETYDSTNYSNTVYVVSYALPLTLLSNRLAFLSRYDFVNDISVGTSLKYYTQGFSNLTGVMQDATGSGMDLDLALTYRPNPTYSFGATLQNALPVDLGGKFVWARNDVEEGIPAVLKVGGAVNVLGKNGLRQFRDQELVCALDLDTYVKNNKPGVWHMGLEWWPIEMLAVRLGLDQQASAVQVDTNLTAGIGLKYTNFTFDYAYHQYGDVSENTVHYFSLGYLGEKVAKIVEEVKPVAPTPKPAPIPVPQPETGLKSFIDVPAGYWAKAPIEQLATAGIISGYPDGTFQPEKTLSRAELCTLLIKSSKIAVEPLGWSTFSDLPTTHWAAPYVEAATILDLVGGYPDGTFKPNKALSRAEAVKIIVVFEEKEIIESIESPFPDVELTHWAANYINTAKEAGILEYLMGQNFEPNRQLTRAEATEMLYRAGL
jgi:hypothetical protein